MAIAITTQEQPPHPAPFFRRSVQGPNVAVPAGVRLARTTQEQPRHPLPFTLRSTLYFTPAADALLLRAEALANAIRFTGVKNTGYVEDLTITYRRADGVGTSGTITFPAYADAAYSVVVSPLASAGYLCTAATAITQSKAYALATVP